MRLIDADVLIKAIPNTHEDMFENCRNCELLDREQVVAIIDNAPTIDLVRCKECKHCDYVDMKTHLWCDCQEHYVLADDFCSYGEREGE